MKSIIALLLILATGACVGNTAPITWTNTSGGNWNNATNWSPNQVPGSSDDAIITASGTYAVTLNISPTVNTLTLGGSSGQQTLNIANNNLTLNNASVVNANGILALAGGNLAGAGLLTVNGEINWTSGSITSSALTIATNGVLVLAGGSLHDSYGSLTNAGTIQLVSGDLRLRASGCGGAGQLINLPGALIDIQSNTSIDDACGGALLVNQGTVQKSGGTGTSSINVSFNNSGLLDVQTGTVNISGGDTSNSTGVFQTEAGATLNFANNFTAYSGVQFNGVGTNIITGGTFTLNGLVTISNLTLAGGTLAGTNGVIAGVLPWVSGSIGQGSTLTIATNGVLVLAGGNLHDSYGSLTNAGTIQLVSGDLRLRASGCGGVGQLINLPGALIDIQSNTTIEDACGGALLVNQGTVQKSGGTGTSSINPVFNNSGTLDVQIGTVNITGGDTPNSTGVYQTETGATLNFANSFTAYSGVQFNGVGTNMITGTFTFNGLVTISNLTLAGGTLAGTNGVIAGVLPWISGSIGQGSTLTVATNGVLVLTGGNLHDSYGSLTNAGTIQLVSGDLRLRASGCGGVGQLINLPGALIDIQSNVTIEDACGGALLVNQGTVQKSGGTGASSINPVFNNSGTLDVQIGTMNINGGGTGNGVFEADAGTTLQIGGGYTAGSGIQFIGAGTILVTGGTFTLNGTFTPSSPVQVTGGTLKLNGLVTISNLTLAGGSLSTTNSAIAGVLTWTSGSIANGSTLTVATNGMLVLAGNNGNDYNLYGTLTNAGTVRLVSGNLNLEGSGCGGPAQLINLPGALVDLTTDVTIDNNCGPGALLLNQGTVRKSGGTGTSNINVPLDNIGLLDVQTGTVNIRGGTTADSTGVFQTEAGATLNFPNNFAANSGVQFTGTGTNLITGGTFTLNGLVTISNLVLAGGSLNGTNGAIAGVLTWTSGSIANGSTLTVATNGMLVLAGNNGNDYNLYGTLTNAGTVRLVSGNLNLEGSGCGGPAQLINLPGALVDLTTDVSIDNNCGPGALLLNQGTVRKSGGTGTSSVNVPLDNTGLLDVQTGTVNIRGGDTADSAGVFQTETGATLDFPNNFAANSGVQFLGAGTNLITGGTFTLNGSVTISNLTLAGASLTGTNGAIAGVLTWASGSIANGSTLTVATNGMLVLAGNNGNDYNLYGTLTNAGTVRLVSGNLNLEGSGCGGPAQLINLPGALVDLTTDVSIDNNCGPGALLLNQGTVRKSGGTGTSTINAPFNNSGMLDVQTGTVNINGGGVGNSTGVFQTAAGATLKFPNGYMANSGVQFMGAGTNLITGGTFSLGGTFTPSSPVLATGGTLAINGLATISDLTLAGASLAGTNGVIAGVLTWTSGSIAPGSTLTIATNGMLVLAGVNGNDYNLYGSLTNAGTVRLVSGNLNLEGSGCGGPAQLINLPGALVDLTADVSLDNNCGPGTLLLNQGTVRKSGGTGTSNINVPLGNNGTVEADIGTISFHGGYSDSSSANLAISLGGTAPGTGYSIITFSTPLVFDGTLTVTTRNGYLPTAGTVFQVLTYPSVSGSFSCLSGLDLGGGIRLEPTFGPNALTLLATSYTVNAGQPQLFITPEPGGVLMTWPLGFPGWVLQSTTNLSPASWTSVSNSCGGNQVIVPVSVPNQYFRLFNGN